MCNEFVNPKMNDGKKCGLVASAASAPEGADVGVAPVLDLTNEEIALIREFFKLLDAWDKEIHRDN